MTGRMGGFSDEQTEKIKENTISMLSELGVDASKTHEALEEFHKFTELDYVLNITGGSYVLADVPSEFSDRLNELRSGEFDKIASPDKIEQFFKDANILTEQRKELLEDYKFFIREKHHKHP